MRASEIFVRAHVCLQMITRQRSIHLRAVGIDSAAQALHIREAVALKISRRVHAARALDDRK